MKQPRSSGWTAIWVAILTVSAVFCTSADPVATAVKPEKSYTGTIVSVDLKEHTIKLKGGMLSRRVFTFGNNCAYVLLYTMLKNNQSAANDLRAGEKVTVSYQDLHGVRVADRIEQQPMQFTGTVQRIDPDERMLTLHRRIWDEKLNISADCIILLRNEQAGTLASIHPGDQVTVTYETPRGRPTAWQITDTSR
jgi:predicted RNA-binding protein